MVPSEPPSGSVGSSRVSRGSILRLRTLGSAHDPAPGRFSQSFLCLTALPGEQGAVALLVKDLLSG